MFALFAKVYRERWTSQFRPTSTTTTADEIAVSKAIWLKALTPLTEDQIAKGASEAIKRHEWPPMPAEVYKLCGGPDFEIQAALYRNIDEGSKLLALPRPKADKAKAKAFVQGARIKLGQPPVKDDPSSGKPFASDPARLAELAKGLANG